MGREGGVQTEPENPLPKTLPGTVCAQMVRCGKLNCKYARGELHGPYFYQFVRVNGVLVKRYVKAKDVAQVRAACQARREEDRRDRHVYSADIRRLIRMVEQLRENEQLLLQFLEANHGKTKKDSEDR